MPSPSSAVPRFDFDIDNYLNPFIPGPRLDLLPIPISRLLGYRSTPQQPTGSLLVFLWSFLGAFTGISLICLIFHFLPIPGSGGAPIIIASLGASAILEYNSISSPLAQPRNVLLGQTFSSIIGIAITRAFQLSNDFENLRWLAGALAVATASAVMGLTKTIHPPAGATALLAATTSQITDLGWFLVPLVMLGSAVILVVACIVNNIQRQFPLYWWTEHKLGTLQEGTSTTDIEKGADALHVTSAELAISITALEVIMPGELALTAEEVLFLERLKVKLCV